MQEPAFPDEALINNGEDTSRHGHFGQRNHCSIYKID